MGYNPLAAEDGAPSAPPENNYPNSSTGQSQGNPPSTNTAYTAWGRQCISDAETRIDTFTSENREPESSSILRSVLGDNCIDGLLSDMKDIRSSIRRGDIQQARIKSGTLNDILSSALNRCVEAKEREATNMINGLQFDALSLQHSLVWAELETASEGDRPQ
ncbi:hypothetical protein L204_104753 [Cryptococcus depauperatus]|nr:hypothetical protein L204_05251 [Cryptococcus depauperatus CBS 7855]